MDPASYLKNTTKWFSVHWHAHKSRHINASSRWSLSRIWYAKTTRAIAVPVLRQDVPSFISLLNWHPKTRLKNCHYKYDASDMLSYMSVLIKISNHLLLILPSAYSSCYNYTAFHATCSTRGYAWSGMKLLDLWSFTILIGFCLAR